MGARRDRQARRRGKTALHGVARLPRDGDGVVLGERRVLRRHPHGDGVGAHAKGDGGAVSAAGGHRSVDRDRCGGVVDRGRHLGVGHGVAHRGRIGRGAGGEGRRQGLRQVCGRFAGGGAGHERRQVGVARLPRDGHGVVLGDAVLRRHPHGDGVVAHHQGDGAAGSAAGDRRSVDRDRCVGVVDRGRHRGARDPGGHAHGVGVGGGGEGRRDASRRDRQRPQRRVRGLRGHWSG